MLIIKNKRNTPVGADLMLGIRVGMAPLSALAQTLTFP